MGEEKNPWGLPTTQLKAMGITEKQLKLIRAEEARRQAAFEREPNRGNIWPTVLPPHWSMVELLRNGRRWATIKGMRIIASVGYELDNKWWVHISCSYTNRAPSWEELVEVRDVVLGKGTWALQFMAPEREHVNIHPHVHHIWHCLDGNPLPDFTAGTGSI